MQDCKEFDILSVTTTIGSLEAAKALAREILARKLAACVQLDQGVTSLYRWKGDLCEEAEVRLVIKTLPGCEAALQALLVQHHPYELPQFLVQTMKASEAYAQWVRAEVVVPQASELPDPV
jgi:periplasmic divalent cation tolerance protein